MARSTCNRLLSKLQLAVNLYVKIRSKNCLEQFLADLSLLWSNKNQGWFLSKCSCMSRIHSAFLLIFTSTLTRHFVFGKKSNKQQGFTLIEVLVAVLVLSIALVAITRSLSVGIRDTQRIQDKNIAHWVALNVLAKAQLSLILIPEDGGAIQTGQESMLNQTWSWKMQSQNIPDLNMRQITVQVFDSKQYSMETLQTYVPLPPMSPYGMNIYAR